MLSLKRSNAVVVGCIVTESRNVHTNQKLVISLLYLALLEAFGSGTVSWWTTGHVGFSLGFRAEPCRYRFVVSSRFRSLQELLGPVVTMHE